MSDYRLSLVAQFDDLVRKKNVLCSGAEDMESEIFKFVKHQELCRQKWMSAEQKRKELSREKEDLAEQNCKLQTKLMHAQSQIDTEIRKRIRLETDKSAMDSNIKLVRDILTDKNQSLLNPRDRERLAFLSTDFGGMSNLENSPGGLPTIDESVSLLSPDITWDNTADELATSYEVKTGSTKKKRPSAPPMEDDDTATHDKKKSKTSKSPSKARRNKKHRRSNSASIIATTTVTVDGHIATKAHLAHDDVKRRDSTLIKYPSTGDLKRQDFEDDITRRSGRYSRDITTPGRPSGLYRSNSSRSLNRPHDFVKTAVLRPEQCVWCEKYMFVRFLKCKECKATAHMECKDLVPTPCVPHTVTPGNIKHSEMTLSDYAPLFPPYIPALVIHCIKEIEARGLNEIGLYRLCGSVYKVKQLMADFLKHRGLPNLSTIADINVLGSCLKSFLRELKEPLLTNKLREDFIKASTMPDYDEGISCAIQAVCSLPNTNRDTLAFIMIHLQKVSESEMCQMNISNLSMVFGPTIVGHSRNLSAAQTIEEGNKLAMVMKQLFTLSRDFWEGQIVVDDDYNGQSYCPSQTPEVMGSILGPMGTPGDSSTVDRNKSTWNTPKFGRTRSQRKNITQFFASPIQ